MNSKLKIKAYAKVNLLLDVVGRRADGYHELAGIMQRISLFDEAELLVRESGAFSVETAFDEPVPENNTARKAAQLYMDGAPFDVKIRIKKHIPSEAGLGGASADAAAVLRGLNAVFKGTGLEKSEDELARIGLAVGADVPFCLAGGCALAEGVGERLSPLPVRPLELFVIKGERGVSTPALFRLFDEQADGASRLPENALDNAVAAVEEGDIRGIGKYMLNALQPAALGIAPEIGAYTELLRACGACGACMTGSGSAAVGLFENAADAAELENRLRKGLPLPVKIPAPQFFAACRAIE